ncbi:MAG TPA: hypothetical protein VII99_12405 [Bacteroidia bacterium]
MKSLQKLHHLIHSLSKTEKRYVYIEISKQKSRKGKIDLQLFDLLKKQEELREEVVLAHPEFSNSAKIIIRCNYLFDFILRCLINYNYSREHEIAIGNHIRIIKNFILKGLHNYTQIHFKKAQKMAERYEDLYRLGILCTLRKIIVNRNSATHAEFFLEIQKIEQQENAVHEKIINLNIYNKYLNQMNVVLKKNSGSSLDASSLKILNKIANSDFLANEKNALTKKARIVFHEINAIYQERVKHNFSQALKYTEKQMELIRDMDSYQKIISPSYINCIKRYCILSSETGQFSNASEVLQQLKKLYLDRSVSQNAFEKSLIFLNYIEAETRLTMLDHEVERLNDMQIEISEGLELFEKMFDSEARMVLYYNLALRALLINNYKAAFRWIERISQEFHGMRIDILLNAHILSLICIFENESVNLFQSRERSYMRHYQQEKKKYAAYIKITHIISHIFGHKNNSDFISKTFATLESFVKAEVKAYNVDRLLGEALLDWMKKKRNYKPMPN